MRTDTNPLGGQFPAEPLAIDQIVVDVDRETAAELRDATASQPALGSVPSAGPLIMVGFEPDDVLGLLHEPRDNEADQLAAGPFHTSTETTPESAGAHVLPDVHPHLTPEDVWNAEALGTIEGNMGF